MDRSLRTSLRLVPRNAGLMDLPECIGAKPSSRARQLEWKRLALRDTRRPDARSGLPRRPDPRPQRPRRPDLLRLVAIALATIGSVLDRTWASHEPPPA